MIASASPRAALLCPACPPAQGSIVYSKMPEHERLRFEAALSVGARTAVHVGNALQYDEYETHIATQLEVRLIQLSAPTPGATRERVPQLCCVRSHVAPRAGQGERGGAQVCRDGGAAQKGATR